MKCRHGEGTSRATLVALGILLLGGFRCPAGARAASDARPIVPRDSAARPFDAGRAAVLRGAYAEAIPLLQRALATGYRQPEQRMGASRFFVERYDPDYWLGRAYMETGNDAVAREHLQRSRAGGLIQGWPEYADLAARLATLDARDAARRVVPTAPPAAPTPAPTATPAPTPTPTPPPLLPDPTSVPSPALPDLGTSGPVPQRPVPGIDRLIRAIGDGDMTAAEAALAAARRRAPDARSLDLLEAVVAGTRYVLSGKREESLLLRARASLGAWRAKGGGKRAEEIWLSPALLALLGRR